MLQNNSPNDNNQNHDSDLKIRNITRTDISSNSVKLDKDLKSQNNPKIEKNTSKSSTDNNSTMFKKNNIKKNIKKIANTIDPITTETIFENNKLCYDVNKLFPIFRNDKMYLYILDSLLEYIEHSKNEIYTNTPFTPSELLDIDKQYKKKYKKNISIKKKKIPIRQSKNNKKIKILAKLDMLGTYFPMKDYEQIETDSFRSIYNELKNMWNAFRNDNKIDENKYFGSRIDWSFNNDIDHETILLDKIDILLNDNVEANMKIMISYVIIGAFAYACPCIKKHYSNSIIFD